MHDPWRRQLMIRRCARRLRDGVRGIEELVKENDRLKRLVAAKELDVMIVK